MTERMIDPDRALALVLEVAKPLAARRVAIERARGRVLAQGVVAREDFPPFARVMMDGLAARREDLGRRVRITGEVPAGGWPDREVRPGEALEVMTGAPAPAGAEVVVPVEEIQREGGGALLPAGERARSHIAPAGSDCRRDARVLEAGDVVEPLAVGTLAALGLREVEVIPAPRVAVIATGRELAGPRDALGRGSIRDSNGPMLAALVEARGLELAGRRRARDDAAAIRETIEASAEAADIVVLSGGVSAGKYDLVPSAIEAAGGEILFHKVTQKPGKPILLAARGGALIFGLPGNPLAAHLGFSLYLEPAARKMSGRPAGLARRRLPLGAPLSVRGGRTKFVLARLERTAEGARALPLAGSGSADLFSTARASAYLRLPPGDRRLAAGDEVDVLELGEERWES